jgi:hypothetical protein
MTPCYGVIVLMGAAHNTQDYPIMMIQFVIFLSPGTSSTLSFNDFTTIVPQSNQLCLKVNGAVPPITN